MPRKNPKGPKWGCERAVWAGELPQLTDDHRQQLHEIVNEPAVVDQLAIAFKNFTISSHFLRMQPTTADIRAALQAIEDAAEILRKRLAQIDGTTEALLYEHLFFQGVERLVKDGQLEKDLLSLRVAALVAERNVIDEGKTGRPSAASSARGLAQEIGRILEHNGLSTSRYDQSPWCRVLRILLEAAGHPVANVRHLLKQQE